MSRWIFGEGRTVDPNIRRKMMDRANSAPQQHGLRGRNTLPPGLFPGVAQLTEHRKP